MDSKLSDLGSERAVLAGLFAYGLESYVEISDFISHNSFAHRNNQVIYKKHLSLSPLFFPFLTLQSAPRRRAQFYITV